MHTRGDQGTTVEIRVDVARRDSKVPPSFLTRCVFQDRVGHPWRKSVWIYVGRCPLFLDYEGGPELATLVSRLLL
jgi:hypothetical protein